MPQEHGNLTEISWLKIFNGTKNVKFSVQSEIQASVSNYLDEDLTKALRISELRPTEYCWVYLDAMQRLGRGELRTGYSGQISSRSRNI